MQASDLTTEEREWLLKLGGPGGDMVVPQQVIDTFMGAGILYIRPSDEHLDLTDIGEQIYQELTTS